MIDSSRDKMIQQATVAAKAEKKLGKQLGGYVALNMKARQSITQLMDEIQSTKRDLETFNMLRSMEEAAAPSRLEKKRDEVASLEKRERDLQSRYAELLDERKERQAAIEQVSTILWCLGRR
jgi:pre-mRNA-splicing factor CDC5/CEF1